MNEPGLRIILSSPGFFAIPLKKVEIEAVPETGRTYFIFKDRIVAVAVRSGGSDGDQ